VLPKSPNRVFVRKLFAWQLQCFILAPKQNAYAVSLTLFAIASFFLKLLLENFERTCKRLKTQSQQIESLQQQSA